jgi:CheY-like chemotaxis protein
MSGLLLSDDLMFTSRIVGTARDLGFSMQTARNAAALISLAQKKPPACVLIDLANPSLAIADLLQQLREGDHPMPFIVAYGSHVDTATLKAARAAGCDLVLPRSQFVAELPGQLAEWMKRKEV